MHGLALLYGSIALGLLASAWGGSGADDASELGSPPGFVTNQVQNNTSESARPFDVSSSGLATTEDPHAFDSVLPPDGGPVVGP